ncbi:MAG TPA: ABC transporter ATP-binding protein [Candidatus Aveggerthella stercoripullorum]|uniref:ABC transporter ATP-binding protein n=1 Tax=Candidatus Aveggerthella stercoripullorum TaxID=2840688 RepID=A0A9D1A247_9ACTN|nr:ABC transporter ATP-binding protein [Candidatus Aveggerthella stercoripullorum]
MSASGSAIEFREAGFSYASTAGAASVHGVSFAQREGECVVVTGPSGCGKTTLARMVNGLIPAVYAGEAEGSVRVFGRAIADWEMDDLSCAVGSVFQNPRSQFFNLDTTSEIAFGCENMGVPRDEIVRRIASTTCALGIDHLLERDIRALSGGEKQLVAVASVYAMDPSAFVLDEPTAALDVRAMLRLRDAVARLKAAGKTVLIAEHRLWWLRGVADRIVLMRDGAVVAEMTADEFAEMPAEARRQRGLRAWGIEQVEPRARAAVREKSEGRNEGAPALIVRGLTVRYGRSGPFVVSDCDFDAAAGRAVALVGRNGAGKTTFARCLAGLHAEAAGEIRIEGAALGPRKRAGRVFLGMQESGYQLFSDTVEGELRLALDARRAHKAPAAGGEGLDDVKESEAALIEAALANFGLENLRDRHPLSLSGGQRQRLAIAAGSLQGSRVLVLDEPTSGLDLANMERIAAEIDRLKTAGHCIVVITHDFEFACATCDEIAHFENGRIAERFDLTPSTAPRARTLFGFD